MSQSQTSRDPSQADLAAVKTALNGLQFGSVTIIVQDGVIVQIDRTEKRRLGKGLANGASQDKP